MIDLHGKVIIVTGASRGIGRCIVDTLASAGAAVACVSRSQEAVDQVARELEEAGGRAIGIGADVTSPDDADRIVRTAVDELGGLHVLVNNAGITRDNLFMRMKTEEWNEVISTNLSGPFLVTRAAVRPMIKQRGGSIINVSSVTARIGNPGQANYTAAKAGLNGMAASLAKELASRNIRVNVVAPGLIKTEMTDAVNPDRLNALLMRVAMDRLGEPQDVANTVAFLASDLTPYVTGQVFVVDGGLALG